MNADVLLKSDRRADLEKWYIRLVDTMLEYINVHAGEHGKTPPQVIKMGMLYTVIFSYLIIITSNFLKRIIITFTLCCRS